MFIFLRYVLVAVISTYVITFIFSFMINEIFRSIGGLGISFVDDENWGMGWYQWFSFFISKLSMINEIGFIALWLVSRFLLYTMEIRDGMVPMIVFFNLQNEYDQWDWHIGVGEKTTLVGAFYYFLFVLLKVVLDLFNQTEAKLYMWKWQKFPFFKFIYIFFKSTFQPSLVSLPLMSP